VECVNHFQLIANIKGKQASARSEVCIALYNKAIQMTYKLMKSWNHVMALTVKLSDYFVMILCIYGLILFILYEDYTLKAKISLFQIHLNGDEYIQYILILNTV